MTSVADTSVKKSIVVNTSVERAFEVFTSGFDSWWPRSHHIGKSPMTAGDHRRLGRRPLLHDAGRRHRLPVGSDPRRGIRRTAS